MTRGIVLKFLSSCLVEDDFSEQAYIPNFIDLSVFKPKAEQRIKGRLLVMPRKNPRRPQCNSQCVKTT